MDRTTALRMCRYYSGEERCPFQTGVLCFYWDMERVFVAHDGEINELESQHYDAIGGKDYPGIPRGILINLFFVWSKGAWDIKNNLQDFYQIADDYLEVADDHYPIDEILY